MSPGRGTAPTPHVNWGDPGAALQSSPDPGAQRAESSPQCLVHSPVSLRWEAESSGYTGREAARSPCRGLLGAPVRPRTVVSWSSTMKLAINDPSVPVPLTCPPGSSLSQGNGEKAVWWIMTQRELCPNKQARRCLQGSVLMDLKKPGQRGAGGSLRSPLRSLCL